jgi:hypothetical protein
VNTHDDDDHHVCPMLSHGLSVGYSGSPVEPRTGRLHDRSKPERSVKTEPLPVCPEVTLACHLLWRLNDES